MACGRISQGGKQAIPFSGHVPRYLGLYFDLIIYEESLLGMTKVQSQTYHSWSKTVPLTAPIRFLERIQFQLGLKVRTIDKFTCTKGFIAKTERREVNHELVKKFSQWDLKMFNNVFQQCFHCTFLKEKLKMHTQFQIQKLRSHFDNCTY